MLARHGYQSPVDVDGAAFAAELARLQRALFAFLYGDLDDVDTHAFTIDEFEFRVDSREPSSCGGYAE